MLDKLWKAGSSLPKTMLSFVQQVRFVYKCDDFVNEGSFTSFYYMGHKGDRPAVFGFTLRATFVDWCFQMYFHWCRYILVCQWFFPLKLNWQCHCRITFFQQDCWNPIWTSRRIYRQLLYTPNNVFLCKLNFIKVTI